MKTSACALLHQRLLSVWTSQRLKLPDLSHQGSKKLSKIVNIPPSLQGPVWSSMKPVMMSTFPFLLLPALERADIILQAF